MWTNWFGGEGAELLRGRKGGEANGGDGVTAEAEGDSRRGETGRCREIRMVMRPFCSPKNNNRKVSNLEAGRMQKPERQPTG